MLHFLILNYLSTESHISSGFYQVMREPKKKLDYPNVEKEKRRLVVQFSFVERNYFLNNLNHKSSHSI